MGDTQSSPSYRLSPVQVGSKAACIGVFLGGGTAAAIGGSAIVQLTTACIIALVVSAIVYRSLRALAAVADGRSHALPERRVTVSDASPSPRDAVSPDE